MKDSTITYIISLVMSITSIIGSVLDWFLMKDFTSGMSTVFAFGAGMLAIMGFMMRITDQ